MAANRELLEPLYEMPNAHRIAVEEYGYVLGEGLAEDRFFTEVEYAVDDVIDADDVVATVERRLGDEWEVSTRGRGEAMVATFRNGDARVSLTTWSGGFDVTVAAEGAKLDGTPLAL